MTKRRKESSRMNRAYNDRAERRRGPRVTVYDGETVLFRGRVNGYLKWLDERTEQ